MPRTREHRYSAHSAYWPVIPRELTKDIGDIDAVKQVETTGTAMVAGDINTLSQIYADNFANHWIRRQALHQEGSQRIRILSMTSSSGFENGPMDAQVCERCPAQGSRQGKEEPERKDTSGQFFWVGRPPEAREEAGGLGASAAARYVSGPNALNAYSQDSAVRREIEEFENDLGNVRWPATLRNRIRPTPTIGQPSYPPARSSPRRGLLQDSNQAIDKLMAF